MLLSSLERGEGPSAPMPRGRDSFLGIVLDGGVRLALLLPERPWLRPYLGVYYTAVPGFDTLVLGSYSGLSTALGVELGLGL